MIVINMMKNEKIRGLTRCEEKRHVFLQKYMFRTNKGAESRMMMARARSDY